MFSFELSQALAQITKAINVGSQRELGTGPGLVGRKRIRCKESGFRPSDHVSRQTHEEEEQTHSSRSDSFSFLSKYSIPTLFFGKTQANYNSPCSVFHPLS